MSRQEKANEAFAGAGGIAGATRIGGPKSPKKKALAELKKLYGEIGEDSPFDRKRAEDLLTKHSKVLAAQGIERPQLASRQDLHELITQLGGSP